MSGARPELGVGVTTAILAVAATTAAAEPRVDRWASVDVAQLDRALPSLTDGPDAPLSPGLAVGYHRALLGRGAVTGGVSVDAGAARFERLFWEASASGGLELALRWRGAVATLGLRVGYARLFTGDNHFEMTDDGYAQRADDGRGFLRISPVAFAAGYAPAALRARGVVPLLTYGWALDVPLGATDGATTWSFTRLGVALHWSWE